LGYEDVWRDWYERDDRVMDRDPRSVRLKSEPEDVMDQRTCVCQFRGGQICEIAVLQPSATSIEEFAAKRHRGELPEVQEPT